MAQNSHVMQDQAGSPRWDGSMSMDFESRVASGRP